MELTIESAFSTGGLVGHLSYLLLVISMTMRVMWVLRVLVILSAFVAIAYDLIWLKDPVGVFWETLLVVVNMIQLSITYAQNRYQSFDANEARFVHKNFPGLSNGLKRKILNAGNWIEGAPGTGLTTEGSPVEQLIYLVDGEAEVSVQDNIVGHCRGGDLIGELTVLSGSPATGSAKLTAPALYWCVSASDLRGLVTSSEEIEQAVTACFHRSMLSKLVAANHHIQVSGGLRDPILN